MDAILADPGETSKSLVILADVQDIVRFAIGWQIQSPVLLDGELTHRMIYDQQFVAIQNRLPWTNPVQPLDVNGDRSIGPLAYQDALNYRSFLKACYNRKRYFPFPLFPSKEPVTIWLLHR